MTPVRAAAAFVGRAGALALLTIVLPALASAAAPVNYQITSNPFQTTATITWATDALSSSLVNYGTSGSYGSASSSAILTTSHSITLTGLTASTTYHFQVGSTDSDGQTLSSDQTFNTAYACTIYVDSVAGDDGFPGTTAEAPWRTLYKASFGTSGSGISSGSTVCLRRGSIFTSTLWVGTPASLVNNVTVRDYGPLNLAMPMIDSGDVIPPSAWTKTGGFTNLYQATVPGPTDNSQSTSTPYGTFTNAVWINAWECSGAPCTPQGAGGNDRNLVVQSSQAAADAYLGSYFISGQTTSDPSAPTTPQSFTIYISTSTNPATNGAAYTYSRRYTGIQMAGSNNSIVNIASKKAAALSGNLIFNSDSGSSGHNNSMTNVESDQGGKHNIFCSSGCTVSNSAFYDGYEPSGNLLVTFDNVGVGLPFTCNNCKVYNAATTTNGSVTAFTTHVGSGPQIPVIFNGGLFKAFNNGFQGMTPGGTTTVTGLTCDTIQGCVGAGGSTTLSYVQDVTLTGTGSYLASVLYGTTSLSVLNSTFCGITQNGAIDSQSGGQGTTTLLVATSTLFTSGAGSKFGISMPNATNAAITVNNTVFDSSAFHNGWINMNATSTSNSRYSGDYNLFFNADGADHGTSEWTGTFQTFSTLFQGLTKWKANFAGQDTHSAIAGTLAPGGGGVSTSTACTLPSYTFSGPSSGSVGAASANFTIAPNKTFNGSVTLWPTGSGSAGLGPTTLTFSNSSSQTFSFTPQVAGSITWTPTSWTATTSPSFEDASALTYTANAAAPGAPQSVTATAGNGQATVSFQGPASNGGSAINWYTVIASPGNASTTIASTTGATVTLTGLSNGTPYTFTVTASNSIGTSSASSASSAVTPTAPAANSSSGNSTPSGQSTSSSGGSSASVAANLKAIYAYNGLPCPTSACGAGTAAPMKGNPSLIGRGTDMAFSADFQSGAVNEGVRSLQQYLNAHGYVIAGSGPGSVGHETNVFGGLTKAALMRFQKDNGIPSTGFFGPVTRGYVNTH